MSLLFLKFWITLQIITRRGYQSKSKACKTPASILHVRAPYRLILVGVGVDPIGIFRKQDYSSKKIDTRGGGRDTRHTLDKRTTLRASHISKPSTISPTMKRNLFFHVQWLQWPAVLAALFTKCFMHASQIWSKSIIGEYRQSCYTAFFFFLIFFSTFFVFFRFWTKFVELSTGVSILSIHPAKQRRFHPGGAGFRFCSRTRDDLLRFKRETVKRQWGNRNTENICNLNSPGEKRIRYFRDSVLRYLGTAAGEFQKWVLGKFVYPRR